MVSGIIVCGAGLAGLAAGHALARAGRSVLVLEKDPAVGGLARTVQHEGFRFDLGGHRFVTDDPRVGQLVRSLLGDELLAVPRASRIFLRGRCIDYPLRLLNALRGLGLDTSIAILRDYARERLRRRPAEHPRSLEDWVVRHFGRALFELYFKGYSEKVWGIDCRRISAEWVAQRIQGLSFARAVLGSRRGRSGGGPRTLAREFLYPALGIGRIAERLADGIGRERVLTRTRVLRLLHRGHRIVGPAAHRDGITTLYRAEALLSSLPLTALVRLLDPPPPDPVLEAAARLRYRHLVVVAVMLDRPRVTDQTWLYFPDPDISFGRLHEPTNWSPALAPPGRTLLVTEHFCSPDDACWLAGDALLAARTIADLERLGLIARQEVFDTVVVRIPHAYPVFEIGYTEHCRVIRDYLAQFENLRLIGRTGEFCYYNMDHAMAAGLEAADALLARPHEIAPTLRTGTQT